MALKKSQRSLRAWTKQEWGTKSGKKSSETGERYLPKAARDALTPAEYAATTAKKRKDTAAGKQVSKQPKKIAKKTRGARQFKNIGGKISKEILENVDVGKVFKKSRQNVNRKFYKDYKEKLKAKKESQGPNIGLGKENYNSLLAEQILRSFLKKSEFNEGGLVGRKQKRIGGKIARGIGDNISKFPQLLDKITDKPVSDVAAQKIFDVENEIKILKDLEKKKKRFDFDFLYDKRMENYDAIYDRFSGDTDKIDDFLYQEFSDLDTAKLKTLETQIENVKDKALKKIEKRLEVVIQNRTIPELDPMETGRIVDAERIANVAANIEGDVFAQKNKAIVLNLAQYVDSPGYDEFFKNTYAARKLSPNDLSKVPNLSTTIKPRGRLGDRTSNYPYKDPILYQTYMNPLEILETLPSKTGLPRTMTLGMGYQKPFFVNPEKLYKILDKSTSGTDFLKLRIGTQKFSDEVGNLEQLIKENTYMPTPIQIFIYPTGNGYIYEGNHRLMRALRLNETEVPVQFDYIAGAERVKGPFSIQNLYKFVNEDKLGFKTPAEYQEYKDEINEKYLIDNYTGK